MKQPPIPIPQPARKVHGYKMPETNERLLSWQFVEDEMTSARYYWIATVNPTPQPHVVPVWGIWYAGRFHFEGGPATKWMRNIRSNPRITVNLPSEERVVILEGNANVLADDELSAEEWERLDSAFQKKYAVSQGSPYLYVVPRKVIAWNGADLQTMTRWIFTE